MESNRFLDQLIFSTNVPPLSQQFFLGKLRQGPTTAQYSPFEFAEDGAFLFESAVGGDLNSESVVDDLRRVKDSLMASAERGFIKSVLGSENKAFIDAKRQPPDALKMPTSTKEKHFKSMLGNASEKNWMHPSPHGSTSCAPSRI